jgi:cholesterol oxidase
VVAPTRKPTPGAGGTTLEFTEEMRGFIALDVADPARGAEWGRQRRQQLMFHLTITADDVDRFVADPDHEARAEGYVDCDLLGGRLAVTRGSFNLFRRGQDPARRRMDYRLHLVGGGGNPLTLVGHKDIHDDPGFDVWRDTSTLYLRILAGHLAADQDDQATPVAAGIITIRVADFLRQLTTFRTRGARPARGRETFGRLFLGELWQIYGPKMRAGATR